MPGSYIANEPHRIELYNSGPRVNLAGYILSTREYTVMFPEGSAIGSGKSFVISKYDDGSGVVDMVLTRTPDFLIRYPDVEYNGNYLVLFDKQQKIVDAVYCSPLPNVPFLPEDRYFYTFRGKRISYTVPPENNFAWRHINVGLDPSIAFVKINNRWRVTSLVHNLTPATDYRNFNVRYFDGIVTLKWITSFEEDCFEHIIERSLDLKTFEELDRVRASGNSDEFNQYVFYDKNINEAMKYYYRIKNVDRFNNTVASSVREVETKENLEEFSWEIYKGKSPTGEEINVRFLSRYSQRIRIKVLDDRYREVAVIFDDYIFAETQNLLKIREPLAPGKYFVVSNTETRRFLKEIEVEE